MGQNLETPIQWNSSMRMTLPLPPQSSGKTVELDWEPGRTFTFRFQEKTSMGAINCFYTLYPKPEGELWYKIERREERWLRSILIECFYTIELGDLTSWLENRGSG